MQGWLWNKRHTDAAPLGRLCPWLCLGIFCNTTSFIPKVFLMQDRTLRNATCESSLANLDRSPTSTFSEAASAPLSTLEPLTKHGMHVRPFKASSWEQSCLSSCASTLPILARAFGNGLTATVRNAQIVQTASVNANANDQTGIVVTSVTVNALTVTAMERIAQTATVNQDLRFAMARNATVTLPQAGTGREIDQVLVTVIENASASANVKVPLLFILHLFLFFCSLINYFCWINSGPWNPRL